MLIVTLDQASLAFGHVALLDRAALALDAGERIGLIGRNGSGKSSLLRVIAGETALDDGVCWVQPGTRIAFVAQEPQLDPAGTVFDAVAAGMGALRELLVEYHRLAQRVGSGNAVDLERLHEVQSALEHGDGWRTNSRIGQALERLGLAAEAAVGTLSGGLKKRTALARALVHEPELLLLDEPTNHLDFESIEWLEGLLNGFPGAVLFVTHDRRFLDRVATRIVELDRGRLMSFPGNFAAYQQRKEEMLRAEALADARFDKLLAQEEVWIRKGIEARRTRNEGRVRRLEALRCERAMRRERVGRVRLEAAAGERSGELVAELERVTKRFGDRTVIRDFSCRILRGDKIGLIGPNGCGKTTLLKLVLGEIEPDSGSVRRGTRLGVAYFDQLREQLDDNAALAEVISPGSEYVDTGEGRKHVMSYLGDFLFPPERARSRVASLSGGERNRLLLARLFARPANVLLLDEPTNDLDLETLELLETLLQDYSGTVFLVSHDRAFLDNVVTQVIAFEGDGCLAEYAGGFEDWQRAAARRVTAQAGGPVTAKRKPVPRTATARAVRLSFKESRELEELPARLSALEAEQGTISAQLADPALYRDRPADVTRLQARFAEIDEALTRGFARWEELEAKQQTAMRLG